MAASVTDVILFLLFVNGAVKCDSSEFVVNLNDILDANLGYFQSALPPNKKFDGKLIFSEIDAPDAVCKNVSLEETENFGRLGPAEQVVNLDTMVNNISVTISTPKMTLKMVVLVAPSYFGLLSPLKDVSVDLLSAQFYLKAVISPSSDLQSCSFKLTVYIKIKKAIIHSDIPFIDNRDITDFFNESIINYLNEDLSTMTIAMKYANCDTTTAYQLLSESVHLLSSRTLDKFINTRRRRIF